ncbi:Uncharacterised protein [Klebsiella pneumoniae]|nr:Uncharacterised protein [Klebsiella pneumoniae]
MARHTKNARLHTQLRLRRKQRFDARFLTVSGYAADNIGGGFRFGFALGNTHHNGDGFCLVCDGIQ